MMVGQKKGLVIGKGGKNPREKNFALTDFFNLP